MHVCIRRRHPCSLPGNIIGKAGCIVGKAVSDPPRRPARRPGGDPWRRSLPGAAPWILILLSAAFLLGRETAPGKFRILILGDSLTEGYGVEKQDAFPARLETKLQEWNGGIEIINGGSSGSTSASGARRLQWYARAKPDMVVLTLGSNDGLRGVKVEETRRNLEAVILEAKKKGLAVCLTGLKVPPNYGEEYADAFQAIFPALARDHGLSFVDFLLEGVAGEPEMNLVDGIHPNEKGHEIIADNLFRFLKEELEGRL